MQPDEIRRLIEWDNNLKIGDIVEARFTNCYNYYSFKSRIVKINNNTLRVISTEPNKPYENDNPGRQFIIKRFNTFISTANNGAYPIKEAT